MSSTLLLVRHADPGSQLHGRLLGASDVPASQAGLVAMDRLVPLLREERPDGCWCSPALRTRQSAAVLARECPWAAAPRMEPLLREIDFGAYELHTFAELAAADPDLPRRWQLADFAFPGGESLAAFGERMAQLARAVEAAEPSCLVLVTHGGVIRTLLCLLLGMPREQSLLFAPRYAALTRLLHLANGRAVLDGFNL